MLPQRSRRRLQDMVPLPPPPPPPPTTVVVSLEALLAEMRSSINDIDLVAGKLLEESWLRLFRQLSPDDFGRIIEIVGVDFDQPRVALLLASHLQNGLTCEYVVASVRKTADLHRAVMVRQLLPLCTDADKNRDMILAELNQWERTVANGCSDSHGTTVRYKAERDKKRGCAEKCNTTRSNCITVRLYSLFVVERVLFRQRVRVERVPRIVLVDTYPHPLDDNSLCTI